MLPVVLILSVLGAVAVESLPVATQNITDDGPLALAQAVKSTLESLATGKSSAYLVDALKDIEAKADVLLEIYVRPIGDLSDILKVKTQGRGAVYVIAAELNADLTVLSEFADRLEQAVEDGDSELIIENVINIKVTASRVVSELSSLNFDANITYDPNLAGRRQEMRKRRGSIKITFARVSIEITWK
jgi:hypothetical protein